MPAGEVAEPFVDLEDVADVAVAALTEDGHIGQVYELTGPRLLTFGDGAAEIGYYTGRTIPVHPSDRRAVRATAAEHDVPAEQVEAVATLFATVLDGRNAHVSEGVQRALARHRGTSPTMPGPPQPAASGTSTTSADPAGLTWLAGVVRRGAQG